MQICCEGHCAAALQIADNPFYAAVSACLMYVLASQRANVGTSNCTFWQLCKACLTPACLIRHRFSLQSQSHCSQAHI